MTSRHVFTQRLKSGVIFSAPGNMLAMPEGGWGDDTPMNRSKKLKKKVKNRGLDQFSHWIAKVTPYDEPYDDIGSFTPDKDNRNSEYRPHSIPPYPEPLVRPAEAEIPEVTLCLPMLSVSLTATVDGIVAHTELVQKFHNPSDEIIDAAKHVFPLYDGAVITSFECTIGDERRVRGVVKPKAQARKEFEEAVRDRVSAPALLEEHTPEIFETSLGNIPANTTVEIKITYVQELKVVMTETEATEGIALTIPMSIAPRYSKSPIEWEPASRVPEEKLDIWIKVMDNGKVNHEGCDEESGHLLQFEGSKPVEYSNMLEKDASTRTYYVWHHESEPPVLRKDFVFVIQMNEGHQIKSGAIACPADDKGLAAMRVNIRPNDLFRNAIIPQSFTGEILFLLDQSGSMGWSNGSPDYGRRRNGGRKIDVMREAMLLALSSIPSTCIFNIISWGSATVGLWGNSQPHTQENIREAKSYVSQMEADMGGTDLLRALEAVVKRRAQERESTQIIILTDGELEPEDSIQFIWKKRQLFGDKVRFFALGIGDEVSHRLVESIAECGGGYSDVVHTTQTPRWHDRLNRLLKSALEPNSWSCEIELGSGFERKDLVDYNLGQDNPTDGSNIPYIQAPFPISPLHPFSFASISFFIDLRRGGAIPKTVTINTTTPGAKRKTYELPIETSSGSDGTIHRLVAKSVLLDLQDQIKRGETETEVAKANAETIGTMYSITSKWTSFVAVSENQPTQTVEEQKMNHYKALFDEIDIEELLNAVDDDESTTSGSSSSIGYGTSQSPRMNSIGPPKVLGMMGPSDDFGYGRYLESANRTLIPAPMPVHYVPPPPVMSSQPNFAGNNTSTHPRGLSVPKRGIPRKYIHPRVRPSTHCQSAPGPRAELLPDAMLVSSGQRATYPLTVSRSSSDQSIEAHSRPRRDSHISDESANQTHASGNVADLTTLQAAGHDSLSDNDRLAGFPLYPADSSFEEAEVLERTRADTADGSPQYTVSHLTPSTAQDSPIHELRDDAPADTAKPGGVEAYAQAVARKRASKSSYPLPFRPMGNRRPRLPKDYAYDGNSDDDTAQDSPPRNAAPSVSSPRLPSADQDGQVFEPLYLKPNPAFYPPSPPKFHEKVLLPNFIVASEGRTKSIHRVIKSAEGEVANEPTAQPRADGGLAIPAAVIKPEEPHVSDDDDTGQKAVAFEEIEVSERTLALADTTDGVTPHSVSDSPTAEDSSLRQPRYLPLDCKSSSPIIYTTNRNPPVLSAHQSVSFSHSPVGKDRQILAPDVSPPSGEPFSHGCAPQSVRGNIAPIPRRGGGRGGYGGAYGGRGGYAGGFGGRGSPRGGRGGGHGAHYSSHRPQTIPSPPPLTPGTDNNDTNMSATYIPQLSEAFFERDSLASGNAGSWCSDRDSYHDERSDSNFGSPSPPPKIYGPLDWQFAMECQDGQGLFDIGEKRPYLHLHFCPGTARKIGPKISELLSNSSIPEQEKEEISARLLDTLMTIECYKTHRAQEEDIWDLMMERAWNAVVWVLGLSDKEEALEELASQLSGAMMHAHYIAATGVTGSEKDERSVETVRCPACGLVWRTTRQFWCPFDHESDNDVDEFLNWDDFWKHQVNQGHVVCTQHVMY
ncbi:von Willebrand factor A domain-containing protein 5A [Fusarium oxysporum f. sp. rapae]|uniref:von Willebrand factor A domain-containing protein 5A n=1 Tax=Fusarium oxysporum f. sp. rapae TaxID=485398 RepID=A0A8J5PC00_FUSOX|nr:von Willebrand factor A domain-containing protein 5A [Fusarium oxysporum f. sp. rapae]